MKESDIRPQGLLEEYNRLSEQDSRDIFTNCEMDIQACPACRSTRYNEYCVKDGFSYVCCQACETVYMNPRPKSEYFKRYYQSGKSARFWSTDFYPKVEAQRKEMIYRPRVKKIAEKIKSFNLKLPVKLVDIGSGYGSFLDECRDFGLSVAPEGIEPSPDLAGRCREKGFIVHQAMLEEVQGLDERFDVAISFEVLEHLHNPTDFITAARKILKPGGLLLMTTLSISGYDFKLLGPKHNNLKPPHHINFFSTHSMELLFKYCGYTEVSVETPGKLDVDILCNRVSQFPELLDNVLFSAVYHGDQQLKVAFQEFLAANGLSSHMWVWAKK